MPFYDEQLYLTVRSAKLGEIERPPVLAHLRIWMQEEFGVSVLHLVFEHIEYGPYAGTPRLRVVLETDDDCEGMQVDSVRTNSEFENRILSYFKKLAEAEPETFDTKGLSLVFNNFAEECIKRAYSQFRNNDAKRIAKHFSSVPIWHVDHSSPQLYIFFQTEEDVRRLSEDGTCDEIRKKCLKAVKKYDEFGYLSSQNFRLKFDSKENVDKNFGGYLRFYFQ